MSSRIPVSARPFAWAILTIILAGCWTAAFAADPVEGEPNPQDMRLLRNPDIHGDQIVFVQAGDLWTVSSAGGRSTPWTVSAQGGRARRLTSSLGYQSQPKFSPDGSTIAFTGNYDGNDDIYVVPATGGEPVRLTWHPGYDKVIDWQPGGESVRFQSRRESRTGRDLQLFTLAHRPADRRSFELFPRRQEDRIQPDLAGKPHLETLQGRHGPGRVDLRLRGQRHREGHRVGRFGQLPHVAG